MEILNMTLKLREKWCISNYEQLKEVTTKKVTKKRLKTIISGKNLNKTLETKLYKTLCILNEFKKRACFDHFHGGDEL